MRAIHLSAAAVVVFLGVAPQVLAQDTAAYPADTLPENNIPPFTVSAIGGSASLSSGTLIVNDDTAPAYRFYQRSDALTTTDAAVMRFRLKLDSSTAGLAVVAGFYDGTKNLHIYFNGTQFGFADASGGFLNAVGCAGTVTANTMDNFHNYELRKQFNSSVQILRDGVQVIDIPYSCLSAGGAAHEGFGAGSDTDTSTSRWDYVVYRIGSTSLEQVAPQVSAVDPLPTAAVGVIHAVKASFSESMHPSTISAETFRVSGSVHGPITPQSVSYDDVTKTATFWLVRSLTGNGETYTITLLGTGTSFMADRTLNTLDGEFSGTFPSGDNSAGGDFVSTFVVTSPDPTTFFGEDINTSDPCPDGSDTPLRPPSIPNSRAMHDQFAALLTGVQSEAFERYAPDSSPATLQFGSVSATLVGSLVVKNIPVQTLDGTYPTSGEQFLLQFGASGTFQITFSSPQRAFGFFATDVGDGGTQLIVRFISIDGSTQTYTLPNSTSMSGSCPNISGSALFFGVIDPSNPFATVVFMNTNVAIDGFGFDDMTIGSTGSCSPVPGAATDLELQTVNNGADLYLTWVDAPDSTDGVVFSDDSPSGSFSEVVGTEHSGVTGLTVPMPSGNKFYLVAGSNPVCGVGPKR